MDSLVALEKDYGYIVAIVASIVGAVMFKNGYDDYMPSGSDIIKEDHKVRGMILMGVAVVLVGGSWYLAYTYQK
jgi:hypothetical protein